MTWHSTIISGAGRGASIKLPTINFAIPKGFPYSYGIYAGYVVTADTKHIAAFHYGPVPTFGGKKISLEAFILSGHIALLPPVEIELIRYLREIKKFPDASTLRAAVQQDIAGTNATFGNEKADR